MGKSSEVLSYKKNQRSVYKAWDLFAQSRKSGVSAVADILLDLIILSVGWQIACCMFVKYFDG